MGSRRLFFHLCPFGDNFEFEYFGGQIGAGVKFGMRRIFNCKVRNCIKMTVQKNEGGLCNSAGGPRAL